MKIKVIAKSKRGKDIINNWGDEWEIQKEQDKVGFSQEKGPWLLLYSAKKDTTFRHDIRWIHKINDENVEIIWPENQK